jgi:hypothetical protein
VEVECEVEVVVASGGGGGKWRWRWQVEVRVAPCSRTSHEVTPQSNITEVSLCLAAQSHCEASSVSVIRSDSNSCALNPKFLSFQTLDAPTLCYVT